MSSIFFNYSLNKNKLKTLLLWCIINYGQYNMLNLAENLKEIGFYYATEAGISLGIDDLKTISSKYNLIYRTKQEIIEINNCFNTGKINEVEKSQHLINNWQKVSEILKQDIIKQFQTINKLNPIYMMAFSGARGNISQVRQLIGMRGLMADPNGQIIHLPIKSNFREGLTVTEYLISCYGARKGVVDTALRTATAGYLTRRLVDCVQHVIISQLDCGTRKGITLSDLRKNGVILFSLNDQLYGRILASDISYTVEKKIRRNTQIDKQLSKFLSNKFKQVFVRSILNCYAPNLTACQLCYGWNLSHSKLVSLGDIVGIIAAQSIGEPGTQLTMRTFHTGGVFSGDVVGQIYAPFNGKIKYSSSIQGNLINTYNKNLSFLVKRKGSIIIIPFQENDTQFNVTIKNQSKKFYANPYTILFVRNNEKVKKKQIIAHLSNKSIAIQEIETQYVVNSKVEGEIYFQKSVLPFQSKKINKIKGKIWILYGKIYKSILPVQFYPKLGDIIYKNFPILKIKLLNTCPSFLQSIIIRKKNKQLLKKRVQKNNISIFSENILFCFLLEKLIFTRFSYLFSIKDSLNIENQQIIRIKNRYKFIPNTFTIPFFKSIPNYKNIVKNEPKNIFKKKYQNTNFREYEEKTITTSNIEKVDLLTNDFFIKKSGIFFYESFLFNKDYKSNLLISNEKIIKYIQNRIHNNFMTFNNYFSKELLFYIEKTPINFYFKTSSLFSSKELKNEINLVSFLIKTKRFFLYPKTYKRLNLNSHLLRNLKCYNKNKINFSFSKNNLELKLFFRISVCNKESLISNKQNKLAVLKDKVSLNNISFYIIAYIFQSFNNSNFLNISQFLYRVLKSNFKFNYSLLELISFFNNFIKYTKRISNFHFFYNNDKIAIIIRKNQNTSIIQSIKKEYLFFLEKNNIIKLYNIPLSFFDFNKFIFYSIKKKRSLVFNILNIFTNNNIYSLVPDKAINNDLITNFTYLIGFLNTKGILYISKKSLIKNKNLFYTANSYFKTKKTRVLCKFTKDFFCLKHKIIFWTELEKNFNKHFFSIFNQKQHSISNCIIIKNRKLKQYDFKNIKDYITLKNIEFCYFNINLIKEYKLFLNKNYNKMLKSQKRTLSKLILDYREKDLILNNFHNPSNVDIFSTESDIFNKQRKTRINFSKIYVSIALNFYIKLPLLIPVILYENKYLAKSIIQFFPIQYKPIKLIKRITRNNFINLTNDISLNSKLKFKVNQFKSFQIYFRFSYVNQIINKPLDKSDILFNKKPHFHLSERHLNWLSRGSSIINLVFLSPYEGEVILNKISKSYSNLYNELLILNSIDKENLIIFNNRNQKKIITIQRKHYFINTSKQFHNLFLIGSILNSHTSIFPGKMIKTPGKIVGNSNCTLKLRKAKPILSPIQGVFYVWNGDFISIDSPIMTLLYHKLQTGDIVQGIPKIEHFFEARKNSRITNNIVQISISLKLISLFKKFKRKLSVDRAVIRSLCKIQKIIIDGILRVYCSQGITISRKHFEIIIKQMTSKVKIVDGGETGLLEGESITFNKIQKINKKSSYKKVTYEPMILGITQTSLQTESFISSASFQETTKVLTQSAVQGKIDFLNGLKENVILGKLIPGGTGIIINILSKLSYKENINRL